MNSVTECKTLKETSFKNKFFLPFGEDPEYPNEKKDYGNDEVYLYSKKYPKIKYKIKKNYCRLSGLLRKLFEDEKEKYFCLDIDRDELLRILSYLEYHKGVRKIYIVEEDDISKEYHLLPYLQNENFTDKIHQIDDWDCKFITELATMKNYKNINKDIYRLMEATDYLQLDCLMCLIAAKLSTYQHIYTEDILRDIIWEEGYDAKLIPE